MKKGIVTIIFVLLGALLAQASINKREAAEEKTTFNPTVIQASVNL